MNLVVASHRHLESVLREGDVAIDGTAGRGRDSLFLARKVGRIGRVISFDVQKDAITSTRELLEGEGVLDRCQLVHGCHSRVEEFLEGHPSPRAAIFNFGWLPGCEDGLVTESASSCRALESLWRHLDPQGMIVGVVYRGHAGGAEESEAIHQWLETSGGQVEIDDPRPPMAPWLFTLQRS